MVAERLVASLRSLHGWQYWAAVWLVCITETLSNDQQRDLNTLVEVTDVADVQFRKPDIRVDNDVGDVTTAPVLTELSRSWCEHETISLESVYGTIISTAFLVVVLEWCERYFDSVCLNMFGLAHLVLILSFRTAHLAATVPCKLDSREGYRQWWRVLLENDKSWFDVQRHAGSDAEGSSTVELFRQLLVLECPCRIHSLSFPESSQVDLQTVVSRRGVDSHERIGKARFQLD